MDGIDENIEAVEGQPQPENLEDAIRILREKDNKAPEEAVGPSGTDGAGDEIGEEGRHVVQGTGGQPQEDAEIEFGTDVQAGTAGGLGGPADVAGQADEVGGGYTNQDFADMQRNMLESVRRQAAMAANEKFKQEGIEKVTLTQLYQRDEETGHVTFYNPDNPDYPFENRSQAQAWVDSYNQQVEAEWVNYANQMQREFASQTLPAMRLMQFGPTYNSMDDRTKKYFDVVIAPYGVKDSTGELIGFSCDLNAAYAQAQQLAAIDAASERSTSNPHAVDNAVKNVATGPALDAVTTGSNTSGNTNENPKNLNEAWKLMNKNKKGKK